MGDLQLYAVTDGGARELEVPEMVSGFVELYTGLPLGTYSALRTFEHNKFLALSQHIARTILSMELLDMRYHLDEQRLRRALHQVVTAFPAENARVRFDVLAEPATLLGTDSRELIAVMPFTPIPASFYDEGIGAKYAPKLQREMARAKTAEYAQQRSYLAPGKVQDHYEFLIVDEKGHILEGTTSNFWAVRDGVLRTAGEGMLEGVTRKIILSLLPQLGIAVRFEAVQQEEVPELDEAAISGSSRAVMPVVCIGGERVGDGRPGPLFRRILHAYQAYVAGAIRTAVG
jgi:branched-subunit amino acid aminotransferase/4-amino-4-deoxychorismate lyase